MDILFIDTETTGLFPEKHDLLEVAALYYKDGKQVDSFHKFIRIPSSGTVLDLTALKVNKTKVREATAHLRESSEEAAQSFADFLLNLKTDKLIPAGQSVSFDIGFIDTWLRNNNIEGFKSIISHRIIDTATLAMVLVDKGRLQVKSYHLKDIAKSLNITFDESSLHSAMADVKLTVQVYNKLLELI